MKAVLEDQDSCLNAMLLISPFAITEMLTLTAVAAKL